MALHKTLLLVLLCCLVCVNTFSNIPQEDNSRIDGCSIHQSALARESIEDIFMPVLKYHNNYELPSTCPFRSQNDKMAAYDTRGVRKRCPYCDKKFKGKTFLEAHWASAHRDQILKNATVCLGDYCDILQCVEDGEVLDWKICSPNENRRLYCHVYISIDLLEAS